MANIDPAPSWADIRQLETTDRNLAGPGGVLNTQPTSIAARLNLLRNNATALNNTVTGVSSRQDAADSAIASLESQVIDAPGTLSDLDHGAPISVTGEQFPDVLSIDNSRGPVLALNESISDLAQRDEWLKVEVEGVLPSLAESEGASKIGLSAGGALQQALHFVSPFMFGGVGNGIADDTEALRTAISSAVATKGGVDLRGGEWRVTGTLEFTNVKSIISDQTSIIRVNSTSFTSTKNDPWVICFGDPDTDRTVNRCVYTAVIGYLYVASDNRTIPLNGIFIKGNFLSFGSIRANGFNGTGVERAAVYDSVFESISTELCGNLTRYSYRSHGYGDTTNTCNVMRLQVERPYHRAFSIECIRSVYQNIHCERIAILTTDDGTTGLATGLTYTNIRIDVGNTSIQQAIFDCLKTGTAPDGQPLAATATSVVLLLDYSSITDVEAADALVSTTRGRGSTYSQITAAGWTWGGGVSVAFDNAVVNPRITGVFRPGAKLNITGGTIATMNPSFNCEDLNIRGSDIANLTFGSTLLGNIVFHGCRFPATLTLASCGAPSGFATATGSIGETRAPVAFRDCAINGTVAGAGNSRAIFEGGYINTVALVSTCQFEFNNVKGQTWGEAGTTGYVTRQCKFSVVNNWSTPTGGRYPIGTLTERIGSGTGRVFFSAANDAATWTQLV